MCLILCSLDIASGWCMKCVVCHQTAASGHGAKSETVEASPEPAGDLQPPPRE